MEKHKNKNEKKSNKAIRQRLQKNTLLEQE